MNAAEDYRDRSVNQGLYACFLGPTLVTLGRADASPSSAKTQLLLAYLCLEAGRPHARSRLAGLLWPESTEADARSSLRQALAQLRKALGERDAEEPRVTATRAAIQLDLHAGDRVDVIALEDALAEGRAPDVDDLAELAAGIRGPLLEGLEAPEGPMQDWLLSQRRAAEQLCVRILGDLAEHHLGEDRLTEADQLAQRQLDLRPFEERAFRQRMAVAWSEDRRQDALILYERCHEVLLDSLGVKPGAETRALHARIVADGNGLAAPDIETSGPGLPSLTAQLGPPHRVIGREEERDAVVQLLEAGARLVTLQAPGGMGKTRLAEAVAREVEDSSPHGVAWVRAGHLESADGLAEACLEVLPGVRSDASHGEAALVEALAGLQVLVVLDELEFVVREEAHASLLVTVLRECPGVRLLVTSRLALRLTDERVVYVEGLQEGAAALFLERVHDLGSHASASLADARAVCTAVHGIPLAIELAARLTRTLTVPDLARLLPEEPALLRADAHDVPERHRSVEVIFESAWAQLTPAAREVLGRCALFQAPFLLEVADEIAGLTPDILGELIDASLVRRAGRSRYGIHTFLRQLSLNRLEDAEQARSHHARVFTARMRALVARAYGPPRQPEGPEPAVLLDPAAHRTLAEEHADLAAAVLHDLPRRSVDEVHELVLDWWRHLRQRGRSVEADHLLDLALEHHPPSASHTLTPPILWTYLRGLIAMAGFETGRAIRDHSRVLSLLGRPLPADFSRLGVISPVDVARAVLDPIPTEPADGSLDREQLLVRVHVELLTPLLLKHGPAGTSYALVQATRGARAGSLASPTLALNCIARAFLAAMLGRRRRAHRLATRAIGLATQADAGVQTRVFGYSAVIRIRDHCNYTALAEDFEAHWQDLPTELRRGALAAELARMAVVTLHMHGDAEVIHRWSERGLVAARGADLAARAPMLTYRALIDAQRSPEQGWRDFLALEAEDERSERVEHAPILIYAAGARFAIFSGLIDEGLRRADLVMDILARDRSVPSFVTSHLCLGPCAAYLAGWERDGRLSAERQKRLRTSLRHLRRVAREAPVFEADRWRHHGDLAHVRGDSERAVAFWKAARDAGDREGGRVAALGAVESLARHAPDGERHRDDAAARRALMGLDTALPPPPTS